LPNLDFALKLASKNPSFWTPEDKPALQEVHQEITEIYHEILHHPEVGQVGKQLGLNDLPFIETTGFFMGKFEPSLELEINTGDRCKDWKKLYACAEFSKHFSQDSYLVTCYLDEQEIEMVENYDLLGTEIKGGEFAKFQYIEEIIFYYDIKNIQEYYTILNIYRTFSEQVIGFTVYANLNLEKSELAVKLLFFRDFKALDKNGKIKSGRQQIEEYIDSIAGIQTEINTSISKWRWDVGQRVSSEIEGRFEERYAKIYFFSGRKHGERIVKVGQDDDFTLRNYIEVKAHIRQVLTDLGCEDLPTFEKYANEGNTVAYESFWFKRNA
jgi:hypothetical protein